MDSQTDTAPNPIAANFLAYSSRHLQHCKQTIAKCCDQLSEEQMWHRGAEHENSVANLLLHLQGNMRQWILHGVDNQPDVRQRETEFALTPHTDSATARAAFERTLDEAAAVIAALDYARLLEVIDPQPTGTWRHTPILEAIYKIVSHADHHTGQIILLTKQLTGRDLDFTQPRKR